MRPESRLVVAAGFASETGRRADNQDFGGVYLGTERERARHGMIAAVADGVGGARGGRMAAELAVRALIEGFYCQPDTIGPGAAAERVMAPYNSWLHATGRAEETLNAATTFTGLILKARRGHVIHVGDTRAWQFRDGRLNLLTRDHTLPQPELSHVLYRAVGVEERLRLDHTDIDLAVHDRLLLTSDGVHGALDARQLERLLDQRGSAEADAAAIVAAALRAGSADNVTALVLDIVALPAPEHDGIAAEMAGLPILPPPAEGDSVDGFRLEHLIADGRYTRLFRAENTATGETVVVKFPKTVLLSEAGARLAFTREALIGQRVRSPFVGGVIAIPPERQSRLYSVQPYYRGETLETRLQRGPLTMATGVQHAIRLVRAVAALHRLEIVHRDIKPENVILTEDGELKLIDLGVARLPRVEDFGPGEIPGTPSYMAPEQFGGNPGDTLTDQFALGVTLYRLFTGRYPYGEVEAFSRPRFGRADPPSRHRPEIPAWLDDAILRAIAVDRQQRHGDVIELLHALEGGGAVKRIAPKQSRPLIERDPVRFWQVVALLLALALILVLARG